jgi:hypothetical protein
VCQSGVTVKCPLRVTFTSTRVTAFRAPFVYAPAQELAICTQLLHTPEGNSMHEGRSPDFGGRPSCIPWNYIQVATPP